MQPLWGGTVGEVVMSANPEFRTGDTVLGIMKFSEYVVVPKGQGLRNKCHPPTTLEYWVSAAYWIVFSSSMMSSCIGNPDSQPKCNLWLECNCSQRICRIYYPAFFTSAF
jgi:hypothetical protein